MTTAFTWYQKYWNLIKSSQCLVSQATQSFEPCTKIWISIVFKSWRLVLLWISKDFSLNWFWLFWNRLFVFFCLSKYHYAKYKELHSKQKYIEYYGKTIFLFGAKKGDILEKQKFSNTKCFQKFEIFWRSSITFCIKIHFSD